MQLLQCGNLTPKNVVCCGPCDDPEYNLQQGRLRKTDSGNSQTIPFTRSLGHFRISLTGLLGERNKARYAPERDRIPEFRVVSNSVFILSFHDRIKKKEVVFVFSTWFDFLPKSAIKIFGVELLQYGNLTPQNLVCCGPSDVLEHINSLASRMLKKEGQTPEITKTTSQKKHQV